MQQQRRILAQGCGFQAHKTACFTKDGHCGTFITTYPFTLCCYRISLGGGSTTSTCAKPGEARSPPPPPKKNPSPPPPKKKPPPPKKKPHPPPPKKKPPPSCSKRGGQCIVKGKRCCPRLKCFRYLRGYGVCL
ncbi:hypothetical protein ABPG77_010527 [Micractinium sp. CCAP 211/92]